MDKKKKAAEPAKAAAAPKTNLKDKTYSHKQMMLTAGIAVVLLLATVFTSLLYFSSKSDVDNKKKEIASLQDKILLVAPEKADEILEEVKEVEPEEAPAPLAADCTGGASYTADIGEFTITLDSPRVIIRQLDAGFEGGPITSLDVGSCVEGEDNVVDSPPQTDVSIIGHPSSSSADLKASFEAQWGLPLVADGTVDVDGVTADKFTSDGLFTVTVVYFDNDGIGYEIKLDDTNASTNAVLNDIVSDWSF